MVDAKVVLTSVILSVIENVMRTVGMVVASSVDMSTTLEVIAQVEMLFVKIFSLAVVIRATS